MDYYIAYGNKTESQKYFLKDTFLSNDIELYFPDYMDNSFHQNPHLDIEINRAFNKNKKELENTDGIILNADEDDMNSLWSLGYFMGINKSNRKFENIILKNDSNNRIDQIVSSIVGVMTMDKDYNIKSSFDRNVDKVMLLDNGFVLEDFLRILNFVINKPIHNKIKVYINIDGGNPESFILLGFLYGIGYPSYYLYADSRVETKLSYMVSASVSNCLFCGTDKNYYDYYTTNKYFNFKSDEDRGKKKIDTSDTSEDLPDQSESSKPDLPVQDVETQEDKPDLHDHNGEILEDIMPVNTVLNYMDKEKEKIIKSIEEEKEDLVKSKKNTKKKDDKKASPPK